jgi:hypothetical protein
MEDALAKWKLRGAELNAGNPFEGSTEARDSLRSKLGYWAALGSSEQVLSYVYYGLSARPHGEPSRNWFENWPSVMENHDFVEAELAKNLAKGVWKEVPQDFVEVVSPLQVEWNPFKHKARLCVDMRYFNSFMAYVKFTMETLKRNGPDVVRENQKLFTIDLEAAYHWLTLSPEVLPYSCFEWKGKFYCSLVPNFGWSLVPFFFTKIQRPVIGFFRAIGIDSSVYLDDFLFGTPPETEKEVYSLTTTVITGLGWKIAEKSMKAAEWEVVHLGTTIDVLKMEYRVPPPKVERVLGTLDNLLTRAARQDHVTTEELHSLEGTLSSMSLAIPPIMLWVRYLAKARTARESRKVVAAPLTNEEKWLKEVRQVIQERNGAPINPPTATLTSHADAGGVGAGAQLHLGSGEDKDFVWSFTEEQMGESSTVRELLAVLLLIRSARARLQGQVLRLLLDSDNAVRILLKFGTTGSEKCHELCKQITDACASINLVLRPVWVPREENQVADRLSKHFDHGELRQSARRRILEALGEHLVVVPVFTNVSQELASYASKHHKVIVVYPAFFTQSWWPSVQRMVGRTIELGAFPDVFRPRGAHVNPAAWQFRASVVDFAPLPNCKTNT